MTVEIRRLAGAELEGALAALAELRIAVFAEWPYLYEGDLEYERDYVREFAAEPGSVLVAAMRGGRMVGAATASPMLGQKREFRAPFEALGYDTSRLFYFGESVLLSSYRGQGIGHGFFTEREAAAREAGAAHATFCAVVRPEDHPARPEAYRPLDAFWRGRGYLPVEGLTTSFAWKDRGDTEESNHPMQFWMRAL
ncbi:GNAT family N-acetyltransferase [Parerythrobacter aestuarii]|uniref:GNAT family N-acetyltransferase n=1 Tax=Parerythrobacter aestuarii TaxID=3020909 RepID=UPI0024DEEB5B|nr:GNAT family N-acetyltransferase [Parerythrobacter aestuarii]